MSEASRPRIFLVGASRAGVSVAKAFAAHGAELLGVWSRSAAPAGLGARVGWERLDVPACDVLLLGVSDDAIRPVAERLAERIVGEGGARPLAVHLAGGRDRAELAPLSAIGCAVASLHPLRSFATPIVDGSALAGVHCAVEAEADAQEILFHLCTRAGGRPWKLGSADKPGYHLAASISGNFVTALISWSIDRLAALGVAEDQAREMAVSLARGAVAQVGRLGPEAALTGPIARGDVASVARQLEQATAEGRADLYVALARLTLALARRGGAEGAAGLRRLLEESAAKATGDDTTGFV